ncbi:receptor kinase-like protein Xa21 [Durio zibethinus]|uniref:non-specific serine/threonine protein kinase n=1 Tax=Durio zibethinus TaxID=66656 RepID=A0A6P5YNW7_DURZI|nr:receptor kinase-like protein Xa21 [Durio zibethinus]
MQALAKWRRVSYQELHQATDGFSDNKLLGVGSFGSVYQGTLSDGSSIAVKVFNLELEGAFKSFDIECEVLRNIRHRHLVKIISSCSNIDFKALILQFMPNGSLEKWLYSHNDFLDMLHRLNVMIDVASALEYLHHGYTTPVIHCDLKPSNILLDEDMIAHLGDFGIAKLLGEHDSTIHTMTLATIGYMAPGRQYSATRDCALSILQLALECTEEVPEERIVMKEVVAKLKKIKIKFLHESNRRA